MLWTATFNLFIAELCDWIWGGGQGGATNHVSAECLLSILWNYVTMCQPDIPEVLSQSLKETQRQCESLNQEMALSSSCTLCEPIPVTKWNQWNWNYWMPCLYSSCSCSVWKDEQPSLCLGVSRPVAIYSRICRLLGVVHSQCISPPQQLEVLVCWIATNIWSISLVVKPVLKSYIYSR